MLPTNYIPASIMQNLDDATGKKHASNWGCENVATDKCPAPDTCNAYPAENKTMYIIQTSLSWFHDSLKIWHEALQDSTIMSTLSVAAIVDEFPNPHAKLVADDIKASKKFFKDIVSVLGLVGTALGKIPGSGGSLAEGVLGVAGGVIGAIGDLVEEDIPDLTKAAEIILEARLQNTFSNFQRGLATMAYQVFVTGDISNWTSSVHDKTATGRSTDLAAFLDGGKYLVALNAQEVEDGLYQALRKSLVGTQLTTSAYYILRGAHPVDKCASFSSGMVIDGICWTIEFPTLGVAEYQWVGEKHETTLFSEAISPGNIANMTTKWGISISDIYTSSYNCQVNNKVYDGDPTFKNTLLASGAVADCFYSLPVLDVMTDDGKQDALKSTPCFLLENTSTTSPIGSWLPDNLAKIFTDDFCIGNCYDIICTLGGGAGRVAEEDAAEALTIDAR
jgi:hypothetical protein